MESVTIMPEIIEDESQTVPFVIRDPGQFVDPTPFTVYGEVSAQGDLTAWQPQPLTAPSSLWVPNAGTYRIADIAQSSIVAKFGGSGSHEAACKIVSPSAACPTLVIVKNRYDADNASVLVLQKAPSQFADVCQIQNFGGTVLGGIDSNGKPYGSLDTIIVADHHAGAERERCLAAVRDKMKTFTVSNDTMEVLRTLEAEIGGIDVVDLAFSVVR